MTAYNVLDEPWIPVVGLDGSSALLGIRETLRRAPELREISVVSPLEEFSVYRFLSVFLMDALRPEDQENIDDLLEDGAFDMEQIEAYISLCESEGVSFDLFDGKRPFMQDAYDEKWDDKLKPKPIASIDYFLPSGNNHLHFEHENVERRSVCAAQAVRLLLALQQFCTAGTQGPSGVNAAPPYFGVIKADTLFETLVFTLLPTQMIGISFDEPPVIWRSTKSVEPKKDVSQTSWLRGMLFPARRVRLVPPGDDLRIKEVFLCAGENFKHKDIWTDPFVSYRFTKDGRSPLRPQKDKPVWRNMHDIIDIKGKHASQLLAQYRSLTDTAYVRITLYGVATSNASYLDVMRHDLCFRSDITERQAAIRLITLSIGAAEDLAKKLRHCLRDDNIIPQNVVDDAVNRFYGWTEEKFWQLCEDSAAADTMRELLCNWCEAIGQFAQDAYSIAMQNVNLRGRALAQAARQQRFLSAQIRKIKEEAET